MAVETEIAWTDATFNPWMGCTHVHAGCTHCYAESFAKRYGKATWGPNGTRVKTSESYWRQPIKWNRLAQCNCGAAATGGVECAWCAGGCVRPKVFCASLADVFEDWQGPIHDSKGNNWRDLSKGGWGAMDDLRRDLFALIDSTPNLDWQLLTKRPENVRRMWPRCDDCGYTLEDAAVQMDHGLCKGKGFYRPNVWIGTSVSNQETADKAVPELLKCRDLAPVLFLSAEPLLGPVDLTAIKRADGWQVDYLEGVYSRHHDAGVDHPGGLEEHGGGPHVDWIIVGGESGPKSRECRPEWIRSIVSQCEAASVPVFIKQMGANVVTRNDMIEDVFNSLDNGWPDPDVEHHIHGFREDYQGADCRVKLRDSKGGDETEWPESLRVRQFPIPEAPQ